MNLTRLAETGRRAVEQAIATSGTIVTISRDSGDDDETVDFDTLEVTDATPVQPLQSDLPALIIATGAENVDGGTDRTVHPTSFRVYLPIAVADVRELDLLTVTSARDGRLTGATLLVTEVLDDAIGVARQLTARRT